VPLVLRDLQARAAAALATGIAREAIVLDPGFGFGKILDENYPLLAHLDDLHTLGFPILAGLSRKSFLTRPLATNTRTTAEPGAGAPGPSLLGTGDSSHQLPTTATGAGAPGLVSETGDSSHQLPTTLANTAAILAGAHILRVHDIPPARAAAAIADRILAN
jgi:dihydropteroate synthase